MVIPSLIRALLEENSVIITGLGTFYVKKVPAQVKEEIIFPPQNIIEFEYSKDAEGFDFVSKVSRWKQIRIDEAQSQISEWLDLLEKGLEHNKTIFFDDFGTFSRDFSGKMIFQSVINSQLNIENEGFEPVSAPSKIKEENNQIISAPEQVTVSFNASAFPQNHRAIDEPVKDKRLMLGKKKKKSDKFWFALIIFIAFATLGALFLKDKLYSFYQATFTKNKVNVHSNNAGVETMAYIDSLMKEVMDEINTFDDNEEDMGVLNEEENSTSPKTSPMESNDKYLSYKEGKYYVIAGSFANEADALRHIKQQNLEKYHAKLIVHPDNPRIRVAIGVFDNEENAKHFAMQIDKNYWVLK